MNIVYIWFTVALFCTGLVDYLLKLWANKPNIFVAIAIILLCCVSNFSWLIIMLNKNELARMSAIWYAVAVPVSILIGVVIFNETLDMKQWFGMGLVGIALYLLI